MSLADASATLGGTMSYSPAPQAAAPEWPCTAAGTCSGGACSRVSAASTAPRSPVPRSTRRRPPWSTPRWQLPCIGGRLGFTWVGARRERPGQAVAGAGGVAPDGAAVAGAERPRQAAARRAGGCAGAEERGRGVGRGLPDDGERRWPPRESRARRLRPAGWSAPPAGSGKHAAGLPPSSMAAGSTQGRFSGGGVACVLDRWSPDRRP